MGRGGKRKLMIGNNLGLQSALIGQISRAGQGAKETGKPKRVSVVRKRWARMSTRDKGNEVNFTYFLLFWWFFLLDPSS